MESTSYWGEVACLSSELRRCRGSGSWMVSHAGRHHGIQRHAVNKEQDLPLWRPTDDTWRPTLARSGGRLVSQEQRPWSNFWAAWQHRVVGRFMLLAASRIWVTCASVMGVLLFKG